MVEIRVTVDTKKADRYLKKVGKNIDGGMNKVLDRELTFLMLTAKMLTPRDTGNLKRGIYTGRTSKTKKIKRGSVLWRELDHKRGASFTRKKGKAYGDFATWMHESTGAQKQGWRSGKPRFFDAAVKVRRNAVIKGVRAEVSKSIKR
jgi:hypothetical protein